MAGMAADPQEMASVVPSWRRSSLPPALRGSSSVISTLLGHADDTGLDHVGMTDEHVL